MRKLFCIVFAIILFTSCATTRVEYVDREIVRYETKEVHDTLREHTHDSVNQSIETKGDTVFVTKYKERTKYVYRNVYSVDTVYEDSIVTQVVTETVEKKYIPTFFWVAFIAASVIITAFIFFAVKKVRTWL